MGSDRGYGCKACGPGISKILVLARSWPSEEHAAATGATLLVLDGTNPAMTATATGKVF